MQLNFIAYDLFGINWNHFERLNYGSYAEHLQYYGFSQGVDKSTIQTDVLKTFQVNTSSSNIRA